MNTPRRSSPPHPHSSDVRPRRGSEGFLRDTPPARVRVTGPPRRRHAPRARTGDIDDQTALGEVYLGSLLREQLHLALRILGLLALTVGSLPLLFHVVPGLAEVDVAGVPIAWPLLGVLVYPWLLALGLRFVRRAEGNERDFVLLLQVLEDGHEHGHEH